MKKIFLGKPEKDGKIDWPRVLQATEKEEPATSGKAKLATGGNSLVGRVLCRGEKRMANSKENMPLRLL